MKRKLMAYFLRTSLILLTVSGCNSMSNDERSQEESATPVTLDGPWFVEYIEDRPVIDNSPANILFGEDGQLSGSASCNRIMGSYEVAGDSLTIGPLATTRKACIDALGEQEQRFLAAIAKVSKWRIENGLLLLSDETGELMFRAATHSSP